MNSRLDGLSQLLVEFQLDALALNPGPSLTYLTGLQFHLMERPTVAVFPARQEPILLLPELEQAKLAELKFPLQAVPFGDDPATWPQAFVQGLSPLSQQPLRLGVEPGRLRVLELGYLQAALPDAKIVDAAPLLATLRLRKDEGELRKMRRAVEIAQSALLQTLKSIAPGQTERQIAAELLVQLYRAGSDPDLPFPPIVSSGPNTANPHAAPSERVLQPDDTLLFDWGAGFEGYFSDITRTFFCGQITAEQRLVADLVYEANRAVRLKGKAGLAAGEIDRLARSVIEAGGYGAYFIHRTGHGLGMEAHEAPYMFAGNPLSLEKGMVFTDEPGIYLPGKFGVRIEDDLVVGPDGLESLTDLPRRVLPLELFRA